MVILNKAVDDFIARLNQSDVFGDLEGAEGVDGIGNIKIIKSYPYVIKPTKLTKIVVAVSLGDVSGNSISIGDSCIFGSYRIDACIYSPYARGADVLPLVAEKIFACFADCNPVSITTTQVDTDATTLCYTIKCSITFSDLINLGGGNSE